MPHQVVAEVLEVVEELEPERRDRQVEIVVGELPPCHADRGLLRQVIANLTSNALKFTRAVPHARIEWSSDVEEDKTIYRIQDNGIGFEMRYAERLFGPFERLVTMDDYEGTGIGLALVERIITRHGGRVWAEGDVGEGATFSFTL